MDKKSLLAFAIAFLILLLYPSFMRWISPPLPPQDMSQGSDAELVTMDTPSSQPSTAVPSLGSVPQEINRQAELRPKYDVAEEEFVVENSKMRVVLSSWGGCIKEVGLKYFHEGDGEMVRLGSGDGPGWKTFALLNGPGWDPDMVFSGSIQGRKVVFESSGDNTLQVRKTYVFEEDGYQIEAKVDLTNRSDSDIVFQGGMGVSVGSIFPHEAKAGLVEVGIASEDNLGNVWRKKAKKVKKEENELGSYKWAGLHNQYYALILRPEDEAQGLSFAPRRDKASKVEGVQAALWVGQFKLRAGSARTQEFRLYAGPKEYFYLKQFPYGFEQIINFGTLAPLSKGVLYLLHYLYAVFHNYGIAIILLTLLIKVVTYPLSAKSFKSMKRMQALQPHISKLKDQHKDNPKKMQKEMMGLYKEHKVNPMGGCLPMLVQLPIFIALFTTLRNAIELKGAGFLWINDLSLPDTISSLAGLPINILPIIMGGTMILQQKMSTVDPQQAKMMMFMPIIFTFLFYSMPSGLVLYWLVNNVLSIAQQYQVQRSKTA